MLRDRYAAGKTRITHDTRPATESMLTIHELSKRTNMKLYPPRVPMLLTYRISYATGLTEITQVAESAKITDAAVSTENHGPGHKDSSMPMNSQKTSDVAE